jgi:DNA repair exonuclease SbcCD ATPase subunit
VSDLLQERGNSIMETSLTELAFIFFFILLIFSAWKISDVSEQLEESENQTTKQVETIEQLREALDSSSEFFKMVNETEPETIFNELVIGREAISELENKNREIQALESTLTKLTEASDIESIEELAESIKELEEAKKQINEKGFDKDDFSENINDVLQDIADFKGQNVNLRNKLQQHGNGLDHPPCWADEVTGDIQYVFNAIINEDNIKIVPGWPEARAEEAENNNNITRIINEYARNSDLWVESKYLFQESVTKECRHFVRIYDHAESKDAFKMYLSSIENHFYKFLSRNRYE